MELFGLYGLGFGSVLLDAGNAVFAAGLGLVAFGYGDDLAVLCLQAETEFSGLVGVDFELGVLLDLEVLYGLILNFADGVDLDAVDSLVACGFRGVDFGSGDDLTVGGLKIELKAGFGLFERKLSHNLIPPAVIITNIFHSVNSTRSHCPLSGTKRPGFRRMRSDYLLFLMIFSASSKKSAVLAGSGLPDAPSGTFLLVP